MSTSFYYADANDQPVGPLSLDEIRRFVAAGVVPPDVLICEADGEEWRPLTEFAGPPRSAPPRTGTPPMARPVRASATIDPKAKVKALSFHLKHAMIAMTLSIIAGLATSIASEKNGGVNPYDCSSDLAAVVALWAGVAELILIYKLFSALPTHLWFTTPLKATGFTLIPGFNIYWAFIVFPNLAEATLRWNGEPPSPGHDRNPTPQWLLPLAYGTAAMVAVSTVSVVIELVGGISTFTGQWVTAICYGVAFAFYFSVTRAMHRILTPDNPPDHWFFRLGALVVPLIFGIRALLQALDNG